MLRKLSSVCRTTISRVLVRRNFGVAAPCFQTAVDPIQKLFIDKIHDYATKSKSAGGKLVDATAETEKQLTDELEKLARQYGAKGADFNKFPVFSFSDPDLEPVGLNIDPTKVKVQVAEEAAEEEAKEDEDKAWFEI